MLLASSSSGASAQDAAATDLEAIAAQIRSAQFEAAAEALDAFLARGDVRARERNTALELLAVAQLARRQTDAADQTLDVLYSRDPAHRLSDAGASPVVELAFVRAAGRARPVPIQFEHEPPALEAGDALVVEVRVAEGRNAIHELRVAHRPRAEGWARVVTDVGTDGIVRMTLPVEPSPTDDTPVSYYFEALAPSGAVLARLGTEDEPLVLVVPPRPPTAIVGGGGAGTSAPAPSDRGGVASSPWLWIAVAAIVVGGLVVGGYFLFGPPSEGPALGDLGVVQLRPR